MTDSGVVGSWNIVRAPPLDPEATSRVKLLRRTHRACQECRSSKTRCDPPGNSSFPCGPCTKKRRKCHLDPDKPQETKQAETDVVRKSRDLEARPSRSHQPEEGPVIPYLADGFGAQSSHETPFSENQSITSRTCPRTLGRILVRPDEINDLFTLYFRNYHQYLEILDENSLPDAYFEKSHLLFWTIIVIAARRYHVDHTLLTSLAPEYHKLVTSVLMTPPHTRYEIQAISLLCRWALPTSSMFYDQSFAFVSTARAIALQLGIHRPEMMQEYARRVVHVSTYDIEECVKTWSALFIVSQNITVGNGQQPLIHSDWTINKACDELGSYGMPTSLRRLLIIQQFSARISLAMSGNVAEPTGLPTGHDMIACMKLLELDLQNMERRFKDSGDFNQISFLCVSIQLRSYYFFEKSPSDFHKTGLSKAFTSAMNFINTISRATQATELICYASTQIVRNLVVAAIILLKLVHSSHAPCIDVAAGKQAFNLSLKLLNRASLENNDLEKRAVTVLTQLWTLYNSHSAPEQDAPSLRANYRASASLLTDALWIWKENFNRRAAGLPSRGNGGMDVREALVADAAERSRAEQMADEFSRSIWPEDMNMVWESSVPSLLPIDLDGFDF